MNITDKLYDILSHSINWVKYAESKNGALLALNSFLFIRLITVAPQLDHIEKIIFLLALVSFFISIILLCISLVPIVNNKKLIQKLNKQKELTPEFMYDLLVQKDDLSVSPKNFLRFFYCKHKKSFENHLPIELLYAEQIYIQKTMRFRKFTYFNRALVCSICGFLCCIVYGILRYI